MKTGWSERVREVAEREYVAPARGQGGSIRIRFGDLKDKMVQLGFPATNSNQIASPLESEKFWKPRQLEMCTPKGQARTSDTIFEFRFKKDDGVLANTKIEESPDERAFRLTEKLRGLMKDKIAVHGGTEGFMRWVRSDEEDAA
jgi:hypothetical protein